MGSTTAQNRRRPAGRDAETGLTVLGQALRSARKAFGAVAVFSFFLNLLMLATPIYMLQVFQRVLGSGHGYTLLYLTLITLFALLILGVLFTVRMWILGRVSSWLKATLSAPLISASLKSTLSGRPVGSQPLRDLGQIQAFVDGQGITAMFDSPWVPVFVAVIWLMHPWLGALGLISAIALFLLALLNELRTRAPQEAAQLKQARANQFAEASLRNAEVAQAMGMLPDLLASYSRMNEEALDHQSTAGARTAAIQGASRFIRLGVQIGVLGIGALLVLRSELTPGQMIAASILLGRALAPVELSIAAWRSFVQARASYEELQSLLRETPGETQAMELPEPEGRIQVEGVSFIPPGAEKPVLRNLNFQVEPGEALVVIGPSAAGKSTLCRLLVGVWTPTVGSVRLDAADVTQWDRVAFGKHVGYLPQDVELFTGSVRQNIARMGEATDSEVVEAARLADVHEMILRLPDGYDTHVGTGGTALSAGQRQRVGLARALLRNPKVVVLDEPGASLDRQGEAALLRALNEFKKRGSTIIVVAHHVSMLEGADKILVIQDGMVRSFGPKNDVLAQLKGSPQDNPQKGDEKIHLAPEPGEKG